MMFKRKYHQKILIVLNNLNTDFFFEIGAYFGGGTQLALQYNEYRVSKDIDFLCPVGSGYRKLRQEINAQGYDALFSSKTGLAFPRDIKADQYGIRFAVMVEDLLIKFEIIAEGRIKLGRPANYVWCPVACLNYDDACTEKLLSNADRWPDESTESRDLIDLAILRLESEFSEKSFEKANAAYPVNEPLVKAVKKFQTQKEYRKKCLSALQVSNWSVVIDGIDLLALDLGLNPTERAFDEKPD
jgi:hypothetical protein